MVWRGMAPVGKATVVAPTRRVGSPDPRLPEPLPAARDFSWFSGALLGFLEPPPPVCADVANGGCKC